MTIGKAISTGRRTNTQDPGRRENRRLSGQPRLHHACMRAGPEKASRADVTEASVLFREIRKQTGQSLSFTAWLIKCVALAVNDYKEEAAYLKNRRSMLVRNSVDVSLTVERNADGYRVPLPCVIRGAQSKSIHREVRAARQGVTGEGTVVAGQDYGGS